MYQTILTLKVPYRSFRNVPTSRECHEAVVVDGRHLEGEGVLDVVDMTEVDSGEALTLLEVDTAVAIGDAQGDMHHIEEDILHRGKPWLHRNLTRALIRPHERAVLYSLWAKLESAIVSCPGTGWGIVV